MKQNFTKADLKDGMVVTNRSGNQRMIFSGRLFCFEGDGDSFYRVDRLESFRDDLTVKEGHSKECDIMKVSYDGKVLWERKEIELTDAESDLLRLLDQAGYHYIARDGLTGCLYAYRVKPTRTYNTWSSGDHAMYHLCNFTKGMFEFVKKDDIKAYHITALLKL